MPAYFLHVDNQVQGPYSEAEVKAHCDAGNLQPDTQVCTGSEEWRRLADALPSLFPPPSPPVSDSRSPATTTPTVSAYSPPEGPITVSTETSPQTYEGIGRLGYCAAFLFIVGLGGILSAETKGSAIIMLLLLGSMLMPASSRIKNIGANVGWCFLLLVPVIGLFVHIACLVLPAGYQDHGKLDIPAKIVGGGFLLLLIGILTWVFSLI